MPAEHLFYRQLYSDLLDCFQQQTVTSRKEYLMIFFSDVSGRRFAIFECDLCKEFDHGDIVPYEEACEIAAQYGPLHLCFDCADIVEKVRSNLLPILLPS